MYLWIYVSIDLSIDLSIYLYVLDICMYYIYIYIHAHTSMYQGSSFFFWLKHLETLLRCLWLTFFLSPRQHRWGVSRRLWGSTPQRVLSGPKKWKGLLQEIMVLTSKYGSFAVWRCVFGVASILGSPWKFPNIWQFFHHSYYLWCTSGFSAWKSPEMMVSTVFKHHTQGIFMCKIIRPIIFQFQFHKPYPILTKITRTTHPLTAGLSLNLPRSPPKNMEQ